MNHLWIGWACTNSAPLSHKRADWYIVCGGESLKGVLADLARRFSHYPFTAAMARGRHPGERTHGAEREPPPVVPRDRRRGALGNSILALLQSGKATTRTIADVLVKPTNSVQYALAVLRDRGLVCEAEEKVGSKGRPAILWALTEAQVSA